MDIQQLRQQVRDMISRNRTDEALELLSKTQLSSEDKELIMLNSRYNRIKEEERLGVLTYEDAQAEISKLNLHLIGFADKIGKPRISDPGSPVAKSKLKYIIPVVLVGAVLIFFLVKSLIPSGPEPPIPSDSSSDSTEEMKSDNSLIKDGDVISIIPPKKPLATCNDGIKNGTETGIDCGGSDCPPCPTNVVSNSAFLKKVQGATSLKNENAYFFNDSKYVRYEVKSATIPKDYPLSINYSFSKNWPSGWSSIDAAVNLKNGSVYFFRGTQYARYDIQQAKIADGYPKPIIGMFSKNWPGGWNHVDASVNLDNGSVYFFRGTQYARYDIKLGRIADGYPLPINGQFANGWPSNWPKVDAAVNYGNGNVYFFRGNDYLRYEIKGAKVFGPKPIIGNFIK